MKKLLFILSLLPLFAIAQDDVYKGSKDFKVKVSQSKLLDTNYNAGYKAAMQNYEGYRGASTGTLIVAFLNPVLGLAPAVGTTSGNPGDLMHPAYDRMKNQQYYAGYSETVKKIRSKRVWNNWIAGSLINIAIVATYFTVQNQ